MSKTYLVTGVRAVEFSQVVAAESKSAAIQAALINGAKNPTDWFMSSTDGSFTKLKAQEALPGSAETAATIANI